MKTILLHGNCFFCVFFACLFLLTACQPANTNIEITKTSMSTTPTALTFVVHPVSSLSLDGDWLFATDAQKKGESENWFAPEYDDIAWQVVSVPHTWNVMEKYSKFNGLAWYRYHLTAPETLQDMHLRLRFQAVFYLARIWVNGVYVGEHEGGYTPFEFDVSAFFKPGQANVITVQVDNKIGPVRIPAELRTGWSFDWWNYGGIVRSVSLEATNPVYISGQQIVAMPHLTAMDEADQAEITSTVEIENTSQSQFDGLIDFSILQEDTRQIVFASDSGGGCFTRPWADSQLEVINDAC